LLADCDTHAEKLQQELKETKEFAAKLQAALDDNTQVESLKQALKEKTELADQLKVALESKQRENKTLEENSLEANHDLEESIKQHEVTITSLKKQYQTLEGEKALLQRELNSARQLNTQINETKNETQKNLNTISLQNRTQATRIKDLEIIQHDLEQQVKYLKLNIEEFKEREKLYREAEELYEQNFQDIADQTYDTTRFLEELRNSSICKELNSKGTQTTLDLQLILKRNTDQADLIFALQEKNSKLLDKPRVKISTMGMGAGPVHGAGGNNSGSNDPQNLTTDTTILDNVTKPIVKVLGELFSREDKKSIPAFKGKSTDKLITEWLKATEHVARNNDWDEDQKLRFFSDRLKGEALEWHEEYVEEQDYLLNYTDWRIDIIERFRDSFDIATLKRPYSTVQPSDVRIRADQPRHSLSICGSQKDVQRMN
jgi:myosin heavy subunit